MKIKLFGSACQTSGLRFPGVLLTLRTLQVEEQPRAVQRRKVEREGRYAQNLNRAASR